MNPDLPVDPDVQYEGRDQPDRPLHRQIDLVGLVALGGSFGALLRYGVTLVLPTRAGHWPMGTLVVNLAGAFILGALLEGLARRGPDAGWRQSARLLLGTGFCGALTTYSTLAVETDLLVRDHRSGLAVLYVAASLMLGLLATMAGIAAATEHHRWRQLQGAA